MSRRFLMTILAVCTVPFFLYAQEQEDNDSLVRLLSASRAQLIDKGGKSYRKVEGDVHFLHNNTYLNCDTALWNVDDQYIDAIGHVQIIQESAILTSDKFHYDIPANLASFRGVLVQLEDRDSNILRTNNLDYNTKDSIATFFSGGSMKDKKGSVIESEDGKFESALHLFTFKKDVEMFSDSMFFVSDTIGYRSDIEIAYFGNATKGWYGDNFISSDGGNYDRRSEKVFFEKDVYVLTEDYEAWCQKLNYFRRVNDVSMDVDVKLLDTADNIMAEGGHAFYKHSPRSVLLSENPAVIAVQKNERKEYKDSIFLRADTLFYTKVMKFTIDSFEIAAAEERLKMVAIDPFENATKNMKDEAAEAAKNQQGGMKGPNGPGRGGKGPANTEKDEPEDSIARAQADSVAAVTRMAEICDSLTVADSLFMAEDFAADSVMMAEYVAEQDSIWRNWKDSTEIGLFFGYHNVKMFRADIQMRCDSMAYFDLDSMARLYRNAILWKDTINQISADSMQMVIQNQEFRKGYLFSNAFVISEDRTSKKYYNQIKAPEMTGFFDNGELTRFDAIGGAQAIFYLAEDSVVTTMNKKETKLMSVRMQDGTVRRIYYLESPKSDAYPVWNLQKDLQTLKGFAWLPELRPAHRDSITTSSFVKSVRMTTVEGAFFPLFCYTGTFFPDYMDGVINEVNARKPLIWRRRDGNYLSEREYGEDN